MIEKWTAHFPLVKGWEERLVYVYLPEDAAMYPDARFPVLYMFDGHNVFFDEDATFGKCWGMKEFMEEAAVPMIIVAVDCNHHPKNGRLKEYSPFNFRDAHIGCINGCGKATMDWFVHTLKPMIDDRYPTLPDRENTFIAGSSMGGLMSLYAITAYNEFFSRAAALSPSLWTSPRQVRRFIEASDIRPGTVLYMDYGTREMAYRGGVMNKVFSQVTSQLLEKGVWLTSRIVPGGEHCEACWEEQLPFIIHTLLYTHT